MIWNYYVLPGYVARMQDVHAVPSGNPKVEVLGSGGTWEEPQDTLDMQRMISREGTLVDEKTAQRAFKHFQERK